MLPAAAAAGLADDANGQLPRERKNSPAGSTQTKLALPPAKPLLAGSGPTIIPAHELTW